MGPTSTDSGSPGLWSAAAPFPSDPFSALMGQPYVAIALTDPQGRYLNVNRRWAEMLGYEPSEVLQLTVQEVTHKDSLQSIEDNGVRLRSGASYFLNEKKYMRKDGSAFWASTTVSAIRDESGRLTGYLAQITDLTQQRRGRLLVECQNEALQLLITGAPLEHVLLKIVGVVEAEAEGDAVACVRVFDPKTGQLGICAAPHLPEEFKQSIHAMAGGVPAAAAAQSPFFSTRDIASAEGWEGLTDLASALGLKAAWSMPIATSDGSVIGAIETFFRRPRLPTPAENEMVAMLAKTAALAIERRKSEDNLQGVVRAMEEQQRLYDTVLSNTPDLMYVFDLNHRFTYANKALLEMWGRTWSEAVGKNCLELGYEPWHAEMHGREIDQVILTKQPIQGEVAFNGTNGRRLYEYIFAPVMGASGGVEAIAGTSRDVTAKQEAASSARLLAALAQDIAPMTQEREIILNAVRSVGRHFNAHRCFFVECNEAENQVKVSENWVRDDAVSLEGSFKLFDFGDLKWWQSVQKGDFAVEDAAREPLVGPQQAANYAALGIRSYACQPSKRIGTWSVILAVTEDRPRRWTADELRLLEDVAARIWPVVERARTEAALALARDEAVAASQAKDNFIAALSHELRTPLNPALLIASDAAADSGQAPAVRDAFRMIESSIKLEVRLIDDLLDLTRIANDKLRLQLSRQNVHGLLRSSVQRVRAELAEKDLKLVEHLECPDAIVFVDEVRVQQIFWNLLKNSIKFTPAGGRIDLLARNSRLRPGFVSIEVSDTGYGLTPAELGRIFQPFAQGEHGEGGTLKRYGGLGLGLAISRKVAEMHSGRISAASPGRNQGATFIVELPLASAEAATESGGSDQPREEPSAFSTRFQRILIVEDHDSSRHALARLLEHREIEVVQASSAAEALGKSRECPFDIVISDIGLPDGNGYDLMRALRDTYGYSGIALTGYGSERDVARSMEAGFIGHLTKPIKVGDLEAALSRCAELLPI